MIDITESRELTTGMDALDAVSDLTGGHIYYAREISGWISVSTDAIEEFITDEQIEALREEAAIHGDAAMVDICDGALRGLVPAIVQCEEVIADALAMVGT